MSNTERDARRQSPAFARNHEPIREVIGQLELEEGWALELGSGPGQHICDLAAAMPSRRWVPSELPGRLESVRAWRDHLGLGNVAEPLEIDLGEPRWEEPVRAAFDAPPALVFSVNVAHIASWEAVRNLIRGAGRLLDPGGVLYFYGPFRYRSRPLEPSNEAFDARLRGAYPGGGLRVFEEVRAEAEAAGLELGGDVAMPANNRSLWFVRR